MDPPYSPLDSPTDAPMDPSLLPSWLFSIDRLIIGSISRVWRAFRVVFYPLLDAFTFLVLFIGLSVCICCAGGSLIFAFLFVPFFAPVVITSFFFAGCTAGLLWLVGLGDMVTNARFVVTVPVFFFSHATRYFIRFIGWVVLAAIVLYGLIHVVESGVLEVAWNRFVAGGWVVLGGTFLFLYLCDLLRNFVFPTQAEGKRRRREARKARRQ
jgi:hypothetical protein